VANDPQEVEEGFYKKERGKGRKTHPEIRIRMGGAYAHRRYVRFIGCGEEIQKKFPASRVASKETSDPEEGPNVKELSLPGIQKNKTVQDRRRIKSL